jgi:hypothetical protein
MLVNINLKGQKWLNCNLVCGKIKMTKEKCESNLIIIKICCFAHGGVI